MIGVMILKKILCGESGQYGLTCTRSGRSFVEPEPDFFAGAGAGEKAPAPGCCCVA